MLIINGTFAVYVWLQNQMNAATTFTIISLFEVLQGPLVTLPFSVSSLIQANVSLNRLQSYLLTDEMMTDCIQEGPNTTEKAIVMRNVNLKWGNDATKPSTTTTEGSAPPKSKVQI
jgi:ABC-type siderophore export system fused ATPase/permease subunit